MTESSNKRNRTAFDSRMVKDLGTGGDRKQQQEKPDSY